MTKFRDLKEYDAFSIEGIDENLIKRGATALRYNKFGVFLGRLEVTNETIVIKGEDDGSVVYA